jgi:hypothetical protein
MAFMNNLCSPVPIFDPKTAFRAKIADSFFFNIHSLRQ